MTSHPELPAELSPNRYIEKVSLVSGEVIEEPIPPHQLLVHHHRDYHIVDIQARRFMSRIVAATGDEDSARRRMRQVRRLGFKTARALGRMTGRDPSAIARALFGLKDREYYFRYRKSPMTDEEAEAVLARLQAEAAARLASASPGGRPALRVLLTGGSGFVGKEILWQAAHDGEIAEVVVVIRPKAVRDRKSGDVRRVISPAERGEELLGQLWLETAEQRGKFRFVGGDVEEPGLGIAAADLEAIRRSVTHVIHCAASVAFDDPYEKSFRANVTGTLNALEFSRRLQAAPESPFVAHLGIETSYIHGRQVRQLAREDEIVFPKNFYNNYYELTKAMASLETERYVLEHGLRVVQLCPAIVIGEAQTGNNRGDTKVVNAPVNLFGLAKQALKEQRIRGSWFERSQAAMLARMAFIFPGDPTAQLNLIPVDWVARGILAAVKRPQAVGRRIHLATDNRVSSQQIQQIVREELRVGVKLADPTLHRNVTLPVIGKVLARLKQERMGRALTKLGTIFAGYSEWGQPVHAVGRDVEILGLPAERPCTPDAFRMLCRHNLWVQKFGQVRDLGEVSRRERVWRQFIARLEAASGQPAARIPAREFRKAVMERLDLDAFQLK